MPTLPQTPANFVGTRRTISHLPPKFASSLQDAPADSGAEQDRQDRRGDHPAGFVLLGPTTASDDTHAIRRCGDGLEGPAPPPVDVLGFEAVSFETGSHEVNLRLGRAAEDEELVVAGSGAG